MRPSDGMECKDIDIAAGQAKEQFANRKKDVIAKYAQFFNNTHPYIAKRSVFGDNAGYYRCIQLLSATSY